MKSVIKTSVFVFFALSLHSCLIGRPITSSAPKNNKTYQVDYLFEHDGCKVYRFHDDGRYVYFTNCTGEVSSYQNDSTRTPVVNVIRKNSLK